MMEEGAAMEDEEGGEERREERCGVLTERILSSERSSNTECISLSIAHSMCVLCMFRYCRTVSEGTRYVDEGRLAPGGISLVDEEEEDDWMLETVRIQPKSVEISREARVKISRWETPKPKMCSRRPLSFFASSARRSALCEMARSRRI